MTTYQELVASNIGKSVRATANDAQVLKIVGLSDSKEGDLAGKKVPHLVLSDDTATVIMLHPRDAKKLLVNGATDKWEVFEVEQTPEELLAQMKADIEAAKVEHAAEQEQKAAPSKKSLATELYKDIIKNGKSRKDFVARAVAELGLTDQGAKTYWSNFHRPNHSWHIKVD